MGVYQNETENPHDTTARPFECGDVSRISGVPVVRPLSVSKPRSLDQPMSFNIVLGIIDPGGCWVSLEDLESGEYDRPRGRSHGRENAIAAVSDVHWRSGDRFVVLEVLQGYDPPAILGG